MSGTREGGLKAAKTNKERHGQDFYKGIGKSGGKKSRGGGFAANPELAKLAGAKGGKISRRGKVKETKSVEIDTKTNVFSRLFNIGKN
jgi:general stress protein YciG